jgi:predicted ATP-dependent endonuclease of OLD family
VSATALDKSNPEKLAQYWEKNSAEVSFLGDGIKAYLRILYSLYLPSKFVVFIDEPEAFLHPPQRRSLGKFIADHVSENQQLFISTHDTEILKGILSGKSRDIKIFHLRNEQGIHSCKVIDGDDLKGSSRNINEQMLNSFFYRTTVICEAEDDRIAYQYASEKYSKGEAINLNFVASNGKHGALKCLEQLRKIDLKSCCILDCDVLYSDEITSVNLGFTKAEITSIKNLRNNINAFLSNEKSNKNSFKKRGIKFLKSNKALEQEARDVVLLLERRGIFVLAMGTLETWAKVSKDEFRKIQVILDYLDSTQKPSIFSLIRKLFRY